MRRAKILTRVRPWQVEQQLLAAPAYPTFCLEVYNGTAPLGCAPPASLLTVMYGPAPADPRSFTGYGADLAPGLNARINYMLGDPAAFSFFLDRGFAPGSPTAEYVRSLVPLGAPLAAYSSATDRSASLHAPVTA